MKHTEALLDRKGVPRRPVPAQQTIVVRGAVVIRRIEVPQQTLLRLDADVRRHALRTLQRI